MQAALIKYLVLAGVGIALLLGLYFMHLKNQNLTLQRDAAQKRADQYELTLKAYQDAFTDQVQALNTERRQEIVRQEHLLETLNLIGDIDETENSILSACSLSIIDRLYGATKGTACSRAPAGDPGRPDALPETPGASLPVR